jgi:acetyl esterase/lipase
LEHEARLGIEFSRPGGVVLTGDLHVPAGATAAPVVVSVHGGGWQAGASGMHAHWGRYLAERGIALFSVNYRLAAEGRRAYPEAVHDVRAAIQFVRRQAAQLKVDPERVGLFGDSAGAHLAALVALAGDKAPFRDSKDNGASTRVKAVVGVYGVYDLAAQWQHDLAGRPFDSIAARFLGAPLVDDRRLYFEASPLSWATRDMNKTAFLLAWGTEDDVVERTTQSEVFLRALKQAGFFARPVIVQGAPHFWNAEPIDEPGSRSGFLAPRMLRFLQEKL